jgi:hypothetical protein
MQSPQEFMSDYFREMVRYQEHCATAYDSLQDRFFARGYKAFSGEKNIEMAKGETVLKVVNAADRVEITTTGYGQHARLRYTLSVCDGAFRIALLEWECGLCSRRGGIKSDCKFCGGKGWQQLPMK